MNVYLKDGLGVEFISYEFEMTKEEAQNSYTLRDAKHSLRLTHNS